MGKNKNKKEEKSELKKKKNCSKKENSGGVFISRKENEKFRFEDKKTEKPKKPFYLGTLWEMDPKEVFDDFLEKEIENKKTLGKSYHLFSRFRKGVDNTKKYSKKSYLFLAHFSLRAVCFSAAFSVLAVILYGVFPGALSAPQYETVTTKAEWDAGTFSGVTTENSIDSIQLSPAGSWNARVWTSPEDIISIGHSSVAVGDYIYIFRGYSENTFWRYDTLKNTWSSMTDLPQPAYFGADLTYNSSTGKIYAIFGNYSRKFYSYDISANTWTELENLLDTPYSGASLESYGTKIYAARGNSSSDFWYYDTATGHWGGRSPITLAVGAGSNLVNGQDGNLYLVRGASSVTFYRYDVAGNHWYSTAAIGGALAQVPSTGCTGTTCTFIGEQKGVYWNGEIYFMRGNGYTDFLKYNLAGNAWAVITSDPAPQAVTYGSLVLNTREDYIYAFRAGGTTDFWKYDPDGTAGSRWIGPKQVQNASGTLQAVGLGGDLIWNRQAGASSALYSFSGLAGSNFFKYDTTVGSWLYAGTNPGFTLGNDIKGTARSDGAIFMPRYNNAAVINIMVGGTWSAMNPQITSANAGEGAGLAFVGNDLYYLRGGANACMYKYTSGSPGSWGGCIATSFTSVGIGATVTYYPYIGARIVSNNTNIYMMPGDGETAFLKYDGSSWSALTNTPFPQYYGSDLTYDSTNQKIYAIAGMYKNESWEFDTANEAAGWRRIPDNQKFTFDRGPERGASIEYAGGTSLYATMGQGVALPSASADMWSFTVPATNYLTSGTYYYTSNMIDLGQVSAGTTFTFNQDEPANTDVKYEICSNTNGATCSSWHDITDGDISDHDEFALERYVWVKITLLTTDGASTPTVYDYTINYASSDTAPGAPGSLIAKSQQTGGTNITSGTEYSYEHPYFSWSAGTDNGSGVSGYYVYFGKDPDADPANDGVFQATAIYSVNEAMTYDTDPVHDYGTYYLIIKAKDGNGLVSDVWDAFTYLYNGVSSPQSLTKTDQSDFNQTGADFDSGNVSYSAVSGSLRLNNTSGFWNQTRLSALPYYVSTGSRTAIGGCKTAGLGTLNGNHCVYAFQANNQATRILMRYEIETDTWTNSTANPTELAVAPLTVYNGGNIVAGPDGYLYAVRGNASPTFWRYDIAGAGWTPMDDAPKNFDNGSILEYDGNRYIYAMPGNDDAFYRYDTCNGQGGECISEWTQLLNANFGNPNTSEGQRTSYGADAIYDNRNNVYVAQGGYYSYFAKYSVETDAGHGESGNTWTTLSSAPVGFYNGGSMAFDGDHTIYALAGNTRMKFLKYDTGVGTWSFLPDAPATIAAGASMSYYNGYLYITRGGGTTTFYRFNVADNTWEKPNVSFFGSRNVDGSVYFPFTTGTITVDDGSNNIYIARGGYDNTFGKYDTSTGTFTALTDLPKGASSGASMTYNEDENAIYYISGVGLRARRSGADTKSPYFYKYNIATNSWSQITADLPKAQIQLGSSMTYDGARYIYLTQGNIGVGTTWWSYDTLGVEGSKWSVPLLTTGACASGEGSKILFKDDVIWKIAAGNTTTTCKYSGGSWSTLGPLPVAANYGASLIDGHDGYIYVAKGGNTNNWYRYDTSQDAPGSWENLSPANVPAQVTYGGWGSYSSSRAWITAGAGGGTTYSDGIYSYVISSSSNGTGFVKTGTYMSEAIDLTQVYKFANIGVNYTTPPNTSLEIQTRTSSNGSIWTSWATVSEDHASGTNHVFSINSNANRYIQIKIIFSSSDQVYSPTVDSYTINYYQDTLEPEAPTSTIAYQGVGSTGVITNISGGTWFNYTAPRFEWPVEGEAGGADDGSGGSGIAGYYVCFGENDAEAEIPCADAYADGEFQSGNTFVASSLALNATDYSKSGKTFYLKIAAVDNAGWPSDSYTGFVYNFDNSLPTNPSTLSADPDSYSSNSFFTISWTDDASDDYSGVNRLQYCTDCDPTDPLEFPNISWVDIVSGTLSLELTPYTGNENTFYLRTVDGAGNVSAGKPKFFYYSGGAASPPTGLTANPSDEDNAENNFTFEWGLPNSYGGDPDNLKYYYSINVDPTPYNTIETTAKSAGPGPFATQYGENTFYVVAMSYGGNKYTDGDIDWLHPAKVFFYAKTTAPGPPLNLQIFDTSDKESQAYSLALKWAVPTSYDAGNFAGYAIYRSDTGVAGTFTEVATTTGTAYVDTELESRAYYYYVKSKDKTNNYSIETSTVDLIPTGRYTSPPTIVSEPSFTVESFAASIVWSTNRVCSSFVEYGTSSTMDKTNGQVDSVTSHTVALEGLSAATKYYYRAKFIDPDGNIGTSDVLNFTTNDPPTISEVATTDIGLNSATISWTTNMSGTCTLKYGKGSLSSTVEESAGGTSHIQKLTSLESASAYLYQIDCVDADLNTFSSDQYTLTTLEQSLVSDMTVQNVMDVNIPTIQVNYKTNHNTSTLVKFKGSNESSYHNFLTADMAMEHEAKIEGLDPAIEYEIIAIGIDENGLEALPQTQKVTTLTDSRPPLVTTNRAVGKVVGRGKDARANLYVKIETDEVSVVKVMFGKGTVLSNFEQSTAEDPANTYHMITIPVEPGQVYSYVISAKDSASNETISKPATVVIENAKENATEIVVSTFGSKFGWISKLWMR